MSTNEMDVIILSKSSKHHKYCVAGVNPNSGDFIRLNSEDEIAHGALDNNDMIYEDGSVCKVLDIVRVSIKGQKPLPTQPENVIIDQQYKWQKIEACSIDELEHYLTSKSGGLVFGSNSYVLSEDQAIECKRSLELVRAKDLALYRLPNAYGQMKSRVDFRVNRSFHQAYYMTDPTFYSVKDGTTLNEAIMLISIPDGAPYFKFVSKIFPV